MVDKIRDILECAWDMFLGLSPVIIPILAITLYGYIEKIIF